MITSFVLLILGCLSAVALLCVVDQILRGLESANSLDDMSECWEIDDTPNTTALRTDIKACEYRGDDEEQDDGIHW